MYNKTTWKQNAILKMKETAEWEKYTDNDLKDIEQALS
jgi:hypothetical protein